MEENNDLVEKPIPSMIRKIAIPASIGFFFHTMYNVVDTYFAGLLSTQALAALSLSFPVFFIIIAFGSGISTGTTALMANALGEGRKKLTRLYATQSISFTVLMSAVLTAAGFAAAPSLFMLLGATGEYLADTLAYMNIILLGTVFFMLTFVANGLLSSIGDTKTFRNVLIAGFLANIVLDPILMFGVFGIPGLGVAGVAWATFIIQVFSAVWMLYKVIDADLLCWECHRMFMPRLEPFRDIARQGMPASMNMLTVALGAFIITFFVSGFGQAAVAAYGIAIRVEQILLMPAIGINISALVLVGQNQGAMRFDRCREAVRKTHIYGLAIMSAGSVAVLALAGPLMAAFSNDPAVIGIGMQYLYIMAFLLHAYLILFLNVSILQGLKRPMFALYIGVFRQFAAAVPIFILLSSVLAWGIFGIWWGIFSINWISAVITLVYSRHVMRNLGKN